MRSLLVCILALAASHAAGQSAPESPDETDLSRYEIFEEGDRLRTLSDIEALADRYRSSIAEQGCEASLPLIVEFHEAANMAANLVRQGNEPFYSASRDERSSVLTDQGLFAELVVAEDVSNNLIRQRNEAWVEEARCLLELGRTTEGVIRLYRALDYIDIDERELWEEARHLLWGQIGFAAGQ